MLYSNAHTHTTFCDGSATAEDMVQAAIKQGFTTLGFSSHSYYPKTLDYGMSPESTLAYIQEINRLKPLYADTITLRLGLELDYYSDVDLTPYEYIIGSVHHYLDPETGKFHSYDHTADLFKELLHEAFHDDILSLARTYYGQVTELITTRKPDIIGHFNLITKYNMKYHLVDETDPAYQKIAYEALLTCAATGAITEINTGAIGRGHAQVPYPNREMLRLLCEHHYPVMITSDCHSTSQLTAGFDIALQLVQDVGYRSIMVMGKDKLFEEVGIADIINNA